MFVIELRLLPNLLTHPKASFNLKFKPFNLESSRPLNVVKMYLKTF